MVFISKHNQKVAINGVSKYNESITSALKVTGVNVHSIVPVNGLLGTWPAYNLCSLFEVNKWCKRLNVQILHGSIADGTICSYLNLPYVHTIHGVLADEKKIVGVAGTHRILDKAIIDQLLIHNERIAAKRADIIVVPSVYTKEKVISCYDITSDKIVVIPNGVNLGEFHKVPSISIKTSPFIILVVCRLVPRKGLIYLLKALTILNRNNVLFVRIVGDGPEKARLQKYCASNSINNVLFLGDLPRDKVINEFLACDVFCLPSLQEGFGIVVLEAMAAHKPVISTNAGAIPEIVDNGKTGILVPPCDEKALSDAILLLLGNVELRLDMGQLGFQKAKLFSWDYAANRLKQIYNRLL